MIPVILTVGTHCTIELGVLRGNKGVLSAYDSETGEVLIRLDENTYVSAFAHMISQ